MGWTSHRDMDLDALVQDVLEKGGERHVHPILSSTVGSGDAEGHATGSNTVRLYVGTYYVAPSLGYPGGRHETFYKIDWAGKDLEDGGGSLELGGSVSFKLAVSMYQALLLLLTNNYPSNSDIIKFILEHDV